MSGKRTILIIEDDITYGEMLYDAISGYGFTTHLAYSATGGIDIIKHEKLDLIISDITMPETSGIQIAEKVSAMYLDIPIVLLTSINDLNLVKRALEAGISDYLVKPIKVDDLPIVIEKNLTRSQMRQRMLKDGKTPVLLKALKVLMRALDAKDAYTHGHSQRVAYLATLMGEELNLSPDAKYTLQLGAFLHDIGKLGIPDSILKKADSLEDYEFRIARDHPVIGSKIISEVTEFSEVTSIVRHHHERYDGTGYPDGLEGNAIPLFARIIAIIDAYEALVSTRCYRPGVDKLRALSEIRENAGKQFDPELTEAFIRVMSRELKETVRLHESLAMAVS